LVLFCQIVNMLSWFFLSYSKPPIYTCNSSREQDRYIWVDIRRRVKVNIFQLVPWSTKHRTWSMLSNVYKRAIVWSVMWISAPCHICLWIYINDHDLYIYIDTLQPQLPSRKNNNLAVQKFNSYTVGLIQWRRYIVWLQY
jgi:hypothetical protein